MVLVVALEDHHEPVARGLGHLALVGANDLEEAREVRLDHLVQPDRGQSMLEWIDPARRRAASRWLAIRASIPAVRTMPASALVPRDAVGRA